MTSEPNPAPLAPVTGDAAVDAALADLSDLDATPVGEHHDRLTRAHQVLHGALQGEPVAAAQTPSGPPRPGPPGRPRPS